MSDWCLLAPFPCLMFTSRISDPFVQCAPVHKYWSPGAHLLNCCSCCIWESKIPSSSSRRCWVTVLWSHHLKLKTRWEPQKVALRIKRLNHISVIEGVGKQNVMTLQGWEVLNICLFSDFNGEESVQMLVCCRLWRGQQHRFQDLESFLVVVVFCFFGFCFGFFWVFFPPRFLFGSENSLEYTPVFLPHF